MIWALTALLVLWAGAGQAVTCRELAYETASFTTCEITETEDTRLVWADDEGPYKTFARLETALNEQGLDLILAMNAGMFAPDLSPLGLYIENSVALKPLVTRDGPGNFGLLPNGVFCMGGDRGFQVIETRRFAATAPKCRFATQSGPMLVIDGELHPRFRPKSDSLNYRNGVGVTADGQTAFLVISNDPVNFDLFARVFRDALNLDNALYLDGAISRLHAPQIGRSDFGFALGPMVVVVKGSN